MTFWGEGEGLDFHQNFYSYHFFFHLDFTRFSPYYKCRRSFCPFCHAPIALHAHRVHQRELLGHHDGVEGQEAEGGQLVLKAALLLRGERAAQVLA